MRKVNAIVMDYDEFEELISEITGGHAGIGFDGGDWFYTEDDEYNADNINKDLSEHLGVNVITVRMDISYGEDDVIIVCE